MRRAVVISVLAGVAAAMSHGSCQRADAGTASSAATARPVVVELFTSEGCNSCPPADELLLELWAKQPVRGAQIIPLEFHVDYWDYIGWKDPFASAQYTQRQKAYAAAFSKRGIYTPQMVVQGAEELVGSNAWAARSAIGDAAKKPGARVELVLAAGGEVGVTVAELPADAGAADVYLAVTQSGIRSKVERGENAGKTLPHAPVVRELRKLGECQNGRFNHKGRVALKAGWQRPNLHAVAFVQARKSGKILGAASRALGR